LIDLPISAWFHAHTDPLLTQCMLFITHWHSTAGVLVMAAALGIALYRAGHTWWLLALLLSVPGGMLLNVAIKHLVGRARPHFDDPLLTLHTYSFPSGHTAGATVFYGFVTVFLLAHLQDRATRVAVVVGAACMVALVGLSRIYLGVHYFTDVVAAVVAGLVWLALCLQAVRELRRRRTGGLA
jgi:membrane-associated phospholipid phosphatase